MKRQFLSLTEKGRWLLATLTLIFTLGIGQMWAAEIFSWTVSSQLSKNTSQDATGGTVTCTGANMGSKFTPTGGPDYYKFSSSTVLTFTLSSGTFAVGDVISFTYTNASSGTQNVGVIIQETDPKTNVVSNVAKGNPDTQSYTVATSDGIAGQDHFSVMRGGTNSSNFAIRTVSVTRSGGDTPICPETLTISSKDSKTAFIEGDKVELTAALAKGNGDISYQWYKGSVAPANAISGATTNKLTINSCAVSDAGSYYCVASKTSCADAVSSAFAITVAADPKCFNMPLITSKPADLASVIVTGGTLTDANAASKAIEFDTKGLKLGGSAARLKVTLSSASIVEGTKITVTYECTSDKGSGIAIYNGDYASKTMDESVSGKGSGSWEHTFTAAEAANYADEFMIDRNGGGGTMIVRAITVEDCGPAVVKHTITLNYNDGVTPNGSLKVVDGKAATQPTDPTRGKYTFLGWFVGDTDNEYVWSTAVTGDITLKAHWQDPWTLTFDADGGSAVADVTVKHNTKAEKPADPTKDDYDFMGWFYGSPAVAFDWDANVTQNYALVAHWESAVAKYDVDYYDGTTKIGTEPQVWATGHPTATGINTTKPLYTFVGWYLTSALEGDPVNLNTVTPVEGLKIYGKWAKAYANSVDFVKKITDDGTSGWAAYLEANNYYIASTEGVSFDNNNAFDTGLKMKTTIGNTLSFTAAAGKVIDLTVGNISGMTIAINGGEASAITSGTDATHLAVSHYYSAGEQEVVLTETVTGYNIIRQITIRAPYQVTFDANGGDPVAAQYGYPSVTLPSASKGTDSFLGWFIGEDKIGEAGDSYTPTADVELVAHWEAVSTDTRIKALTYAIGAGTPVNIYEADENTFNVVLPYAKSYDAITVATTPNHENASIKAGAVMTVSSLPGSATFTIVAQSGAEEDYTVNFSLGPKDGVSIIKATTNNVVTGLIGGTIDQSYSGTSDSRKLNKNNYFGVTLANSETFQEGDVMIVNITTAADLGKFMVYADAARTQLVADQGIVYTKADPSSTGEMSITLPAAANGKTSLYLSREDGDTQWNVTFSYIEVKRPMMPEMTAITINGEDAVKGTGNTFTITLPEEGTDFAALTVVPTVIRNAAHATTPEAVISNSGAWAEGANTYRVMDKDGDYTDYTITITLQGEAPAPVIATQPAGVAYCAGSEPTLEVVATGDELHYAWFKEAGETDEAVGTDLASYTVEAAGTYYVIVTNHVDGKLDKSVTSENAIVTLNTPASITTQPTDLKKQTEGANITLSVVAANATAYQWYSCDNKDKENPSLIPGADEAEYEFAAAAGFFYCEVTGLCGTIESNVAEVTIKRTAGCQYINATSGSQANLADGTIMYACGSDGKLSTGDNFATASANAKALDADAVGSINKQYCVVKFPVDIEEITLYGYNGSSRSVNNLCYGTAVGTDVKVNTAISSDDYVKTASNDGNERSMTIEFDEPFAKEKYLFIKYNSALEIYRICYTAALVEPKLPTLVNQELCAGAAYEAFDATITNAAACEGTVSYKWFSTADTETPVATTAEFTPSTDGTYYVVVTHSAAGHMTRVAQSAELTVAHFAAPALVSYSEDVFQHMGTAAELSVVATGSGLAYAWYTCDVDGGNAEVISGAEEATYAIASIAEGVQYYKVVISNNCDESTLSHIFKVEGWDQLEQVDVTESTVWDMNNVSASEINLASMTPSKQNVLLLLANIEGVNNNASFNSQALMFEGQRIGRTENNVKYVSGQYVQFNVTVPGMVSVTFASNGSAQRTILINGKQCSRTTTSSNYIRYDVAVEPGSVEIEDVQGYVRISKIEFKAEDNYHRAVNPSYLGTLCWTNNAVLGGATLYEFAGKNEYNYLVFDEVAENRLEAGKPYIFMPENGSTEIKVYNTDNEAAKTESELQPVNHMYGTVEGKTLVPGVDDNMYYFSASHIWAVKDFTVSINVPAYYCYVDYEAVLNDEPAQAPAPGRRRVTMGVQGQQVATGIEDVQGDKVQCTKMLINGQLFILRGEKMYDAKGQLVK